MLEEIVLGGEYTRLSEYVHEDVILPGDMDNGITGLAAYREGFLASRWALPYTHVVQDMIAEEDKVVARLTVDGVQIGPFMGIPHRGARFSFEQIVIARFRGDRVAQFWRLADRFALREQLARGA